MKAHLLGATALAAFAIAWATPGAAQTAPAAGASAPAVPASQNDDPNANGPDIVITGSLIRGTPEDAALPVEVIGAGDLQKQGSPSGVELLKSLSVSNGVLGDSNQFDGRSQGSEGIATVNLRGLGPQRSLVLLNSKRLVAAGNGLPAVDINMIPLAAIGRIEVLKDGAAATYGSDAVAGVVNFITRTDQEGFRVAGTYKAIQGSAGDFDVSASVGHNAGALHVLVAGGYQRRNELDITDRDFATRPYADNPQGGFTGGGNPTVFLGLGPTGAPNTGLIVDASCSALGGIPTTPTATGVPQRCTNNYTKFDALTDTEYRGQVYTSVGIDLKHNLKFEVTGLYGFSTVPHYKTTPSYLLTQPPSSATGITQSGFFVPASNPGFIAYQQQNPGSIPAGSIGALFPTLLFRPFLLGGNPLFTGDDAPSTGVRRSETARVTAELSGALTKDIDFDVSATYQDYYRYVAGFDEFGDRVQLALRGLGGPNCNVAANTPGANGCLYLNPFGNGIASNAATGQTNPNYISSLANTAALSRWFFVPYIAQSQTSLFVTEASISGGTGIRLPGGEVKFALGGQYRRERYSIEYGANNNLASNPCRESPVTGTGAPCLPNQGSTLNPPATGALAFLGTNANTAASSSVYATYGELQVPILSSLNAQLGLRYEDYGGGVGSTVNPQARLRFQATNWLAFRGGVGTTFRGPRPENLVPTAVTTLQILGSAFRPVDVFGSSSLKPEKSTNYSGGILLKFGGFHASVDYFRYDIKDGILSEPVAGMLNALFSGTHCTDPAYAALRSRFQFSDGNGVPGAGTCSLANVSRLTTFITNGAKINNSGLDFLADYRGTTGDWRYGAGVSATYTIHYITSDQTVAGVLVQPAFDAAGKLNYQTTAYPVPAWKGQGYIDLGNGPIDARVTVNYIDSYHDQRADVTTSGIFGPDASLGGQVVSNGATIGKFVTADFNLQVRLPWNVTGTVTVNNIFNQAPPFARLDYDYDPFTASALLRTVKVGLSTKF